MKKYINTIDRKIIRQQIENKVINLARIYMENLKGIAWYVSDIYGMEWLVVYNEKTNEYHLLEPPKLINGKLDITFQIDAEGFIIIKDVILIWNGVRYTMNNYNKYVGKVMVATHVIGIGIIQNTKIMCKGGIVQYNE